MNPSLRHACTALLCVALLVMLGGCAAAKWLGLVPKNPLKQLQVSAAADANANTATSIDVVWVFNTAALATLPKTGPLWFAGRAKLLAGRSSDLAVLHLDVPVGSAQQQLTLPAKHGDAIAVLAYANYIAEAGQAVATLTSYSCVRMELGAANVSYVDCK